MASRGSLAGPVLAVVLLAACEAEASYGVDTATVESLDTFFSTAAAPSGEDPYQGEGRALVNETRRAHGLAACDPHEALRTKAQAWAERLAGENALYHSDLATTSEVGWRKLGENVGYGPTITVIHDAYLRSPSHRRNVLEAGWTHCAVGVASNVHHTFTVQLFLVSR